MTTYKKAADGNLEVIDEVSQEFSYATILENIAALNTELAKWELLKTEADEHDVTTE